MIDGKLTVTPLTTLSCHGTAYPQLPGQAGQGTQHDWGELN